MTALPVPRFKGNPKRGQKYRQHAVAFVQAFPPGTKFGNIEFDEWAFECGFLERVTKPMIDNIAARPAWEHHRKMRQDLRRRIKESGCHRDMVTLGLTPFSIKYYTGRDLWETITAEDRALDSEPLYENVIRALDTEGRGFRWAMEAVDLELMPPTTQSMATLQLTLLEQQRKRAVVELHNYRELRGVYYKQIEAQTDNPAQARRLKKVLETRLLPFLEKDEEDEPDA